MKHAFPAAVPEIPVSDMNAALDYYHRKLGFDIDWAAPKAGSPASQRTSAGCSSRTVTSASIMATLRR